MDDRVGNRGETAVSTIDIDRDIIDLVYIYIYIYLYSIVRRKKGSRYLAASSQMRTGGVGNVALDKRGERIGG